MGIISWYIIKDVAIGAAIGTLTPAKCQKDMSKQKVTTSTLTLKLSIQNKLLFYKIGIKTHVDLRDAALGLR